MARDEGQALLDELMAHATQRQFVYSHRWRVNDLVLWDNRCVLHRGRPFDDLRWPHDAQRATSLDVGPTCEQEGIAAAAAVPSSVNLSPRAPMPPSRTLASVTVAAVPPRP